MKISDMTNNELAKELNIEHYCPQNTNRIRFSLQFVADAIGLDCPVVLLGACGGYLNVDSITEMLSEENFDHLIRTLPLGCDESHMSYLKEIVSKTDLETWALSFEKLFYVSVLWLSENLDTKIKDYQYSFETLWDDFCFVPVAYEDLFFPPSPSGKPTARQAEKFEKHIYKWVISNTREFLIKEKAKIETEDLYDPKYCEDFEGILEGWWMRHYEGEIPKIVQERQMAKGQA